MNQCEETKIFAFYLPQFHETPENNEFWGEGFTDWHSVKNAESYFVGHNQPKVPLNENYYDLSKVESLRFQAELAKKSGISGFCMYHYWFENDKKVLYKPAELLLENKDIDIEFCFMWDNTSWIRSWSKCAGNAWAPTFEKKSEYQKEYLLKLDYGNEEQWKTHFEYLLPFFKDSRYVKIDNKPIFGFFSTMDGKTLKKMGACWEKCAVECGFDGMYLISRRDPFIKKDIFQTEFIYQPATSAWLRVDAIKRRISKYFLVQRENHTPKCYNYDRVWKRILVESGIKARQQVLLCGFVNYDDTPRRGKKGKVITGGTPEKFEKYFTKLYRLSNRFHKKILFLMAWNEWGEGSYLEPDTMDGYEYLMKIKKIIGNK